MLNCRHAILTFGKPLNIIAPCHRLVNRLSTDTENHPSFRTVDLAYVSYETAMSGDDHLPPLVIFHGLLGSKSNWTSLSKVIHKKTGRKIIAVDARNHGDSPHCPEHTYRHMVEDIVALLNKLSIPKISVLGHSMGGRTAMLLSLLQSDLVSSLIVADMSPFRTSPNIYFMSELFDAMNAVSIPKGLPMSKGRKLADAQLSTVVKDVNIRNFIITNLIVSDKNEYQWRINVSALKENFHSNIALFTDKLDGLKYEGHALFIAGGNSDYVGRDELVQLRTLFPLADLTFIEGAGHWVHSEKPEPFSKLVCDFLYTKYSETRVDMIFNNPEDRSI